MKPSVLFVCTHNSARSQLAEGLLRHLHGDRFEAYSAGTEATRVKPEAAAALREVGIDPSAQYSKTVDDLEGPFDYVVTVCDAAKEACPYVAARIARVHRSFADPSDVTSTPEARMDAFRAARDEIRAWIERTFAGARPEFA
jgi:arsenate reductase